MYVCIITTLHYRRELSHCTVLCIAHRLHTIAYYDLVMVMDKGQVVEFADPFTLMSREDSLFRGLCQSSGDFDELLATAARTTTTTAARTTTTTTAAAVVAIEDENNSII